MKKRSFYWAFLLGLMGLLTAGVTLADDAPEDEKEPVAVEAEKPLIPLPVARPLPRRQNYSRRREFRMPPFDPSWGLNQEIYEKAVRTYNQFARDFENNRFVTVVDLGIKSTERRFFLFDLLAHRVDDFRTTHGRKSDPKQKGVAENFSNEENSLQSSLGNYLTLNSYTGEHGYSLRLRGMNDTNSNVEKRAIVIHPAPYVSELAQEAGRSWGCLALDPTITRAIINRIRGGSLLVVDSSYVPEPSAPAPPPPTPAPEAAVTEPQP